MPEFLSPGLSPSPAPAFLPDPASARTASITDFVDPESLQEIQDAFSVITRLQTTITDGAGNPVTQRTDIARRAEADRLLEHMMEDGSDDSLARTAPIIVQHRQVGSLAVQRHQVLPLDALSSQHRRRLHAALEKLGASEEAREELLSAAEEAYAPSTASSMQLLYLIANSIAQMGFQQHAVNERLSELSVLFRLSTALAGHHDLGQILSQAAQAISDVMNAKGVNIRLLESSDHGSQPELVSHASFGLSADYTNLGRSLINKSELRQACLCGEMVFVADVATDARVFFPEDARKMGLHSMLATGIMYHGRPIGMVQVFTGEPRVFAKEQQHLLQAIAQLLATAIENARLGAAQARSRKLIENVQLAADVQRRMMPTRMPEIPGFEMAAIYEPSLDLGGDFYDAIPLGGGTHGLTIADMAGKGVPAALQMAALRTLVRAHAPAYYDLDAMLARVNQAMAAEGRAHEFATLFYATLDPKTKRLTYCNAGHEPPVVVRDGKLHMLETGGLILGVDAAAIYQKGIWDFRSGDILFCYTDGLPDASDPQGKRFGREALLECVLKNAGENARTLLGRVMGALHRHIAGGPRADDMTALVLKVD